MKSPFLLLAAAAVLAQPAPPIISPEVHADRRVTFRLRDSGAKEVFLAREGAPRLAMQKDEQGVWNVTTEPLEPDFYGYTFSADGATRLDPGNPLLKPNLLNLSNMVHVPGPATLAWEVNDVPRGTLHRHFYKSAIVGDHRDYYVYTPPGYDAAARQPYPVLYLLHGFSDDASGWTAVGRAHVILDNLIAQQKAKHMLIVMTLGYGAPEMVSRSFGAFRDASLRDRNYTRFRDSLLQEVIPRIEKDYRVSKDRKDRAIAGLSMGGSESLFVGLNAIDRFAWIGAFSSGGLPPEYEATFPALDAKSASQLKLLWISCGTEDRLIDANRKLSDFLVSKQVRHTYVEGPGAHTWMVWRRNLATLAPMLFRD
jgi:enterochelin esterase-like enzyme